MEMNEHAKLKFKPIRILDQNLFISVFIFLWEVSEEEQEERSKYICVHVCVFIRNFFILDFNNLVAV